MTSLLGFQQETEIQIMNLLPANQKDIFRIMEIIQEAKEFLKAKGVNQWQKEYPDKACIEDDIKSELGYVCVYQKKIVGYVCIDFNGEPIYNKIDGQWLSIQPYVVIHRLALDNTIRGQGIASKIIQRIEEISVENNYHSFKVDTDADNKMMKSVLLKNGFQYCGIVIFDNSEKIAYEKLI